MSLWKENKSPKDNEGMCVDPEELVERLRALLGQGDFEVVELGIESLLEELDDYEHS